jgi:hypothetical protein
MFKIEKELQEDIIDLKKTQRTPAEAKQLASNKAVEGFNPFQSLFNRHVESKKKALAVFKHEMKQAKDETNKVTLSTNFISGKTFVWPRSGKLIIGVHVYLAGKKGFFQRLMSGAMGNWFTRSKMLGVKAIQEYVAEFAGEAFSKQINKDNVFNAVGEKENEGKVSYYCALKVPSMGAD